MPMQPLDSDGACGPPARPLYHIIHRCSLSPRKHRTCNAPESVPFPCRRQHDRADYVVHSVRAAGEETLELMVSSPRVWSIASVSLAFFPGSCVDSHHTCVSGTGGPPEPRTTGNPTASWSHAPSAPSPKMSPAPDCFVAVDTPAPASPCDARTCTARPHGTATRTHESARRRPSAPPKIRV